MNDPLRDLPSGPQEPPPPPNLGGYRLLELLGRGGMGEVYRAERDGPGGYKRRAALKRILPRYQNDPTLRARFLAEARINARLEHPNVVQVLDFGDQPEPYLALEFVEGTTAARVLKNTADAGARIPAAAAAYLVAEAATGLDYAHRRKDENGQPLLIVHRDVSPQNILISLDGAVKISDFGIARAADNQLRTAAGVSVGKLAYMAPEQASGGTVDRRADVFALGIVLWECLLVRPLIPRNDPSAAIQLLLSGRFEPPSRIDPSLPAVLDKIVLDALAVDPARRIPSAGQLAQALRGFLHSVAPGYDGSELVRALSRLVPDVKWHEPASAPRSDWSGQGPPAVPAPLGGGLPAPAPHAPGPLPGPLVPPAPYAPPVSSYAPPPAPLAAPPSYHAEPELEDKATRIFMDTGALPGNTDPGLEDKATRIFADGGAIGPVIASAPVSAGPMRTPENRLPPLGPSLPIAAPPAPPPLAAAPQSPGDPYAPAPQSSPPFGRSPVAPPGGPAPPGDPRVAAQHPPTRVLQQVPPAAPAPQGRTVVLFIVTPLIILVMLVGAAAAYYVLTQPRYTPPPRPLPTVTTPTGSVSVPLLPVQPTAPPVLAPPTPVLAPEPPLRPLDAGSAPAPTAHYEALARTSLASLSGNVRACSRQFQDAADGITADVTFDNGTGQVSAVAVNLRNPKANAEGLRACVARVIQSGARIAPPAGSTGTTHVTQPYAVFRAAPRTPGPPPWVPPFGRF